MPGPSDGRALEALSPADAKILLARSLDLLPRNSEILERRVILAVSGGPDSLALLATAAANAAAFVRTRFHVVTIDHGLRPEAAAEARFVGKVAARFGLPHLTRRWESDKPAGNRQGRARQARYDLLVDAARDFGATAIMTAHHQDDQIETHLLAQARNAGDRGLAGMRPSRELAPGIRLLRPFLGVPGAALKAAAVHLDPVDDPSNRDLRYDRVRFRQQMAAGEIDCAAVLAAIATHVERRDTADRRLGVAIADLLGDGRLTVDGSGTICLEPDAFAALDESLGIDLVARILTATAGGTFPPLRPAMVRLRKALLLRPEEGIRNARTLGGVVAERGASIVFTREYGRAGPVSVHLAPGVGRAVFDGRFDLTWDPLPMAATLVPLGLLGLGHAAQRSLPVVIGDDGVPLAAPAALSNKLPDLRRLASVERVSWRLVADLPFSRATENSGILGLEHASH